jgi:hypothetical protein
MELLRGGAVKVVTVSDCCMDLIRLFVGYVNRNYARVIVMDNVLLLLLLL